MSQHMPQIAFGCRTDVGCWSHGWQILPTLAIGRILADFCQPLLRLDVSIFCRRWANGGFLFKMAFSNNGGFWKTYYGMSKNHISVSPQILTNKLSVLHIKIIYIISS